MSGGSAIIKKIMNPCREIFIDGRAYAINTEFYVWIEIENLLFGGKDDEQSLAGALALAFPVLPPEPKQAIEAIMWFICGGRLPEMAEGESGAVPCFDIRQDFGYIWGAFISEFGIDLSKSDMHWWHFLTLLGCLSDGCKFSRIVGCRSLDLRAVKDKEMRQMYAKMKKKFALKGTSAMGEQQIVDSLEGLF